MVRGRQFRKVKDRPLFFCPKCEGLIIPHIDGEFEVFKCKKCNDFIKKEKRITLKSEVDMSQEECKDEDYDFENKEFSRLRVMAFLEKMRSLGYLTKVHSRKVLILSHIKGLDILKLIDFGFKRKNIYIIERESEVLEQMKKSSVFKDVKFIHKDLIDFQWKMKFDLFYLDFKSNISYGVLNILSSLLLNHINDNTIFYINLQMAREVRGMIDHYNSLKEELVDQLYIVDSSKSTILANSSNYHLLRQKFLQRFVKNVFEVNLTEDLSDSMELNKRFDMSINVSYDYIGKKPRNQYFDSMMNFMQNSFRMLYFNQFIYRNRANTPFLSTLFIVKRSRSFLKDSGFSKKLFDTVLYSFLLLYARNNKLFTKSIDYNYEKLSRLLMIECYISKYNEYEVLKEKGDLPKQDQYFKDSENCLRKRFNVIKNIAKDMFESSLSEITVDKKLLMNIKSFWGHCEYTFHLNTYDFKKISHESDFMVYIFYHFIKFLRKFDNLYGMSVEIDECLLIDENNHTNFHDFFSENKSLLEIIEKFIENLSKGLINANLKLLKFTNMSKKEVRISIVNGIEVLKNLFIINKLDSHLKEKINKPISEAQNVLRESMVDINNEEGLRNVIIEIIKRYPELKSKAILGRLREYFKSNFDVEIEITEHQIRAHKAWITMRGISA